MKIGIIGAGAIGLLCAAKLNQYHAVTLITRSDHQKQQLLKKGILLDEQKIMVSDVYNFDQLEQIQRQELWIVCVKQSGVGAVWQRLRSLADVPVLFLQNGMGHIDILQQDAESVPPIMLGAVEHGVKKDSPINILHTGLGRIKLADLNGKHAEGAAKALHAPDFPAGYQADWFSMLAEKLVVNAVINPLTAIFRVTNGELLRNAYFKMVSKLLCEETAAVLEMDQQTAWERVRQVMEQTAANKSSMLRDLEDGRQTEIDAISGYVLAHAETELPYTSFVYHSIKGLEAQQKEENNA